MKCFKKLQAILLCLALIVTSLSACKKTDSSSTGGTSVTEGADSTKASKELVTIDYSKPAEYTYWLYATPNDYYSNYSDNPAVQYLNQKFNLTLSFDQPAAGTETDSLNLMFGTGEYTDLIDASYYSGSIGQLYDDGVIVNIADYLDYMPNFKKLLDSDEVFRKNSYDDQGRILKLTIMNDVDSVMWGGMVYRRDILDTMTGGNVAFPSGNDVPTTIEDWDYMLPLMKQYFEASGMQDYGVLILPSIGYFNVSNLVNSFGVAASYYVDQGTVKYGPMEDGFYNYLKKMNEWYKAGYIYKDFASRSNDLFYLPNTSLTYGGAAGVWFGLSSQLGTALSLPDYGLNVDVQGIPDPIDTSTGVTAAPNYMFSSHSEQSGGAMVSTSCDDIERLLATLDFLYSEEGSYLKGYGLDKEHGSADNELYVKNGLADGAYTVSADGSFTFNSIFDFMGGTLTGGESFRGLRLPGLCSEVHNKEVASEVAVTASDRWTMYQDSKMTMPISLSRTSEEDATYTNNQTNIDDYLNTMVLKFILGTEELNDKSWTDFKSQLESFGISDNLAIQQAAYDRYVVR